MLGDMGPMDSLQSSQPIAPRPHGWKFFSGFGIGGTLVAILILVVAIGYVLYTYSPLSTPIQSMWSIATMPSELKLATFVADTETATTLYRVQGSSFAKEEITGALVSAERGTNGNALIVRSDTGYKLMVNGVEEYATSTPLLGITATADGSRAVVAAQLSKKEDVPVPAYVVGPAVHPFLWTNILLHLDGNGGPLVIGTGVNSVYLDATHIIRVAPVGIASVDMSTGEEKILAVHPQPTAITTTLVSPDRTRIGWYDSNERTITIYRITPDTADQAVTIPAPGPVTSYALGNDALYAVQSHRSGAKILRQGFSETKWHTLMTVPSSLRVTRLLLGSL